MGQTEKKKIKKLKKKNQPRPKLLVVGPCNWIIFFFKWILGV